MTITWFRSHHGAPFDSKLAVVARRANVTRCHAAAVWWAVLDHASQHETRGCVDDIDAEEIAAPFDIEEDEVLRILEAMRLKSILIDGDGMLTAWDKRQTKREDNTATERKQRQRSREKEQPTQDVTQGHADVTPRVEKSREDKKRIKKKREAAPTKDPFTIPPSLDRRKETVMPLDWRHTDDDANYYIELGGHRENVSRFAETFHEYYTNGKGRKEKRVLWSGRNGTWGTWCRREFAPGVQKGGNTVSGKPSPSSFNRAADDVLSKFLERSDGLPDSGLHGDRGQGDGEGIIEGEFTAGEPGDAVVGTQEAGCENSSAERGSGGFNAENNSVSGGINSDTGGHGAARSEGMAEDIGGKVVSGVG